VAPEIDWNEIDVEIPEPEKVDLDNSSDTIEQKKGGQDKRYRVGRGYQ
jgi:hypothetical protein